MTREIKGGEIGVHRYSQAPSIHNLKARFSVEEEEEMPKETEI